MKSSAVNVSSVCDNMYLLSNARDKLAGRITIVLHVAPWLLADR